MEINLEMNWVNLECINLINDNSVFAIKLSRPSAGEICISRQ